MNEDAHPAGFYEAYPEVTYDLAEERWLGTAGRSDVLDAHCRSCGWRKWEQVAARHQRIAEFTAKAAHWYECPGEAAVEFRWITADVRALTSVPVRCRVRHRTEAGPRVELCSYPAPRRAVLSPHADDKDYAYVRELSPWGRKIYKKLLERGFTAARALAFAKAAQKTRPGYRGYLADMSVYPR